jgi:hypothetical protein
MKRTLNSLLLVALSLIATLGGGWMYFHSKARSMPIKTPFDHPYLHLAHKDKRPLILFRTNQPSDTPAKLASEFATRAKAPLADVNLGLWLDVRLTNDGALIVSRNELLTSGSPVGKPIELATVEDCKTAGLFELKDFASNIEKYPTVLNLIARRPGLAKRILDLWGPSPKPLSLANTVLHSESDGVLKELREAQPRGLYGTSQSSIIQIEMLSNLGLQALVDLKSDLLISSTVELTPNAEPRLRKSTLDEAKRRGLKRYAGPTSDPAKILEMLADGYDGVLID